MSSSPGIASPAISPAPQIWQRVTADPQPGAKACRGGGAQRERGHGPAVLTPALEGQRPLTRRPGAAGLPLYPSDGGVVVLAEMRAGMMAQGAARAGGPHPGCAAMHVQHQYMLTARPDRLELTFCQGIASFLAGGQLSTPPRKQCREFLIEVLLGE